MNELKNWLSDIDFFIILQKKVLAEERKLLPKKIKIYQRNKK